MIVRGRLIVVEILQFGADTVQIDELRISRTNAVVEQQHAAILRTISIAVCS